MKPLNAFTSTEIKVLFTDIDGTLTENGKVPDTSYTALWNLQKSGVEIVPVTGRPAGWCEMIARTWPVTAVVGENGGFYFQLEARQMKRVYAIPQTEFARHREQLRKIEMECLTTVPGCQVASDQFARLMDLAIDFAEDVGPLSEDSVDQIVSIFTHHGALAKVSNIHVNGWFGDYDKLTMCKQLASDLWGWSESEMKARCAFAGDSPNDEPMFAFFPNSFAVANIKAFAHQLKNLPTYLAEASEANGFEQIARALIRQKGLSNF